MNWETVWRFKTARFEVQLQLTPDSDVDISFDDTSETRDNLASGAWQAFGSRVRVLCDGCPVSEDSLWGSIYATPREFWTAHRSADPMNRNCSIMRKVLHGSVDAKISICHYFPDMVRIATAAARERVAAMPKMRLKMRAAA